MWVDVPGGAAEQLAALLCRMRRPDAVPISSLQVFKYWEANIDAAVALPAGIKFLIASFVDLFGTPNGVMVQQWCVQSGFLLVWALGSGVARTFIDFKANSTTYGYNHRAVDPVVSRQLGAVTNFSATPATLEQFQTLWKEVANHRDGEVGSTVSSPRQFRDMATLLSAAGPPTPLPPLNGLNYTKLWAGLPNDLEAEPLAAARCSDAGRCIGTAVHTGDCICYARVR
jgi:hypothetical protein